MSFVEIEVWLKCYYYQIFKEKSVWCQTLTWFFNMFWPQFQHSMLTKYYFFVISNLFDNFTRFGKVVRTLFLKMATFVSIFFLSKFIQICTKWTSNARKFLFQTNNSKKVWKNSIRTTYDIKVQSCFSPIFLAETLFSRRTIHVANLVVWLVSLRALISKFTFTFCVLSKLSNASKAQQHNQPFVDLKYEF